MHPLLNPDRRTVVAHRGNRAHAPENTLEAFDQAVALGADALEFDVHVTADGVPVVHHDATLDRTTDGVGLLAGRTLAELHRLDAGARYTPDAGVTRPYRGRSIRIPTLAEVLDRFPETPLLIEIKAVAAADPVRQMLQRHAATERAVVDAFDGAALVPFRGAGMATGSSRNGVARLLATTAIGRRPSAVPYRAVCIPRSYHGLPLPVYRFARALRPLGVPVHVWTVNDPTVATALWEGGVSGIITDDPGTMLRARAAL